jgi:uncharacterized integral membrane protein
VLALVGGMSTAERRSRQNVLVAKRSSQVERGGGREIDRRRAATLVGVGIAVVLLVWFALGNIHDVSIEFWFTSRKAPLIIVILISGLLGALIGALVVRRRQPKGKE